MKFNKRCNLDKTEEDSFYDKYLDSYDEDNYELDGYIYTSKVDASYVIDNSDRENQFTILHNNLIVAVEYSFSDALEKAGDLISGIEEPTIKNVKEFEIAEKSLGETDSLALAGYITVDGRLIDFSGGRGTRALDHRQIGSEHTKSMQEYMNMGNIRIDWFSGSIDMMKKPTKEQFKWIRQFIRERNGEVFLTMYKGLGEFSKTNGYYYSSDEKENLEYRSWSKEWEIMAGIKEFYDSLEKSSFNNWYKLLKF